MLAKVSKVEDDGKKMLLEVMELQRQWISNLESEYDELYTKYDSLMEVRTFNEKGAEKLINGRVESETVEMR